MTNEVDFLENRSRAMVSSFLDQTVRELGWSAARVLWAEPDGVAIDPWRIATHSGTTMRFLADQPTSRLARNVLGDDRFLEPVAIDPAQLECCSGFVDELRELEIDQVVVLDVPGVLDFDARFVFVPQPGAIITPESRSSIQSAAHLIPTVLRQEFERGELNRVSLRDPLTGLLNRKGLHSFARSLGESEGLRAVVFVDIDQFKTVNDTYGHGVGDEVLVEAGVRLATQIRPTDLLGRLGGDEFVVVADSVVDEAGAFTMVKRLVAAAAQETIASTGDVISVTVSAGIVFWQHSQDFVDAVHDADTLMYEAKRIGGGIAFMGPNGNVIVADPLGDGISEEVTTGRAPVVVNCVTSVEQGHVWGAHLVLRGELSVMNPPDAVELVLGALVDEGLADIAKLELILELRGRGWSTGNKLQEFLSHLSPRLPSLPYIVADAQSRTADLRNAIVEAVAHDLGLLALAGVGSSGGDIRFIAKHAPQLLVVDRDLVRGSFNTKIRGLGVALVAAMAKVAKSHVVVLDADESLTREELDSWGCDFASQSSPNELGRA
ncbi:MAG: GGDEF domain-containing protein [Microbacteriaceae bacterium]